MTFPGAMENAGVWEIKHDGNDAEETSRVLSGSVSAGTSTRRALRLRLLVPTRDLGILPGALSWFPG